MKSVFKSKCNYNKKMLGKIVFITVLLIIIFTFFLVVKFNKNMSRNLENISEAEIRRITYDFVISKINNKVINKDSIKDILIINKNAKDEILYVDFDLDKAYKVLDKVTNILGEAIKGLENGAIDMAYLDKEMTHKNEGLTLAVPMGSTLKSNYFYNLGPKLPVKINFIGSLVTNLETKVTNYGLNNALVEMFIYVKFRNELITPFKLKNMEFKYDAVIASMMIEGEVPSFYNGSIDNKTNDYQKVIE